MSHKIAQYLCKTKSDTDICLYIHGKRFLARSFVLLLLFCSPPIAVLILRILVPYTGALTFICYPELDFLHSFTQC